MMAESSKFGAGIYSRCCNRPAALVENFGGDTTEWLVEWKVVENGGGSEEMEVMCGG